MQSYLCQYIFNYDTLLYFINAPLRAHKSFTEHLKVVNLRRP